MITEHDLLQDWDLVEYVVHTKNASKEGSAAVVLKDKETRAELEAEYEEQYKQPRKKLIQQRTESSLTNVTNLTDTTNLTNLTESEKKQKKREFKLQSMLAGKRPEFKQLKGGVHEGKYYFGTVLYDEERPVTAILTSDRQIYCDFGKDNNELREKMGLYYREDFHYDALDTHISNEGIRRFLSGENVSLESCYNRIKEIIKKYMYYPQETSYDFVSLDILSTYFLPLFSAKGRKLLHAEKGSGKTRQSDIINGLACNSVKSPDTTSSSFFRLMESTVWTLVIDDFDSIGEEQRTAVLQHYKTGYKPGSKSLRTGESNKRGKRSIESFNNYGHVVINNTTGLDDISQDRTLTFQIVKSNRDFPDLPKPVKWPELVDDLYICALCNWDSVRDAYENIRVSFRGRNAEISKDLIAIASLIDESLADEVESHIAGVLEQSDFKDLSDDWYYLAIKVFYNKPDGHTVKLSDIANAVFRKTNADSVRGVSSALGRYFKTLSGIFSKKRPQNVVHIRLESSDSLNDYLDSKGWLSVLSGETGETGETGEVYKQSPEQIDMTGLSPESIVDYVSNSSDDLVDVLEVEERFGEEAVKKALKDGDIHEPKKGFVKIL